MRALNRNLIGVILRLWIGSNTEIARTSPPMALAQFPKTKRYGLDDENQDKSSQSHLGLTAFALPDQVATQRICRHR